MIQAMFRSLLLVVALLAIPPVLVGCSNEPSPKDPSALGAAVRDTGDLIYRVGVKSLDELSKLHASWVDSIRKPSPAELQVIDRTTAGLLAVGSALEKAKPWIDTGKGEAEGKTALRDALKEAQLLAAVLVAAGAPVPPRVVDALTAALGLLGDEAEAMKPPARPAPPEPQPPASPQQNLETARAYLRGIS